MPPLDPPSLAPPLLDPPEPVPLSPEPLLVDEPPELDALPPLPPDALAPLVAASPVSPPPLDPVLVAVPDDPPVGVPPEVPHWTDSSAKQENDIARNADRTFLGSATTVPRPFLRRNVTMD
jgi:hypothetical protein